MRKPRRAPTWLLPYAGLMTALFALFVVLYGASRVELEGMKAKGEPPAAPTPTPTAALPRDGDTGVSKEPQAADLRDALTRAIHDVTSMDDFSRVVLIVPEGRGLWIRLLPRDLFAEGSGALNPRYHPLLREIGRTLLQFDRDARVEGHASAREGAARGADAWALSAARAGSVLRVWTEELHYPAKKLIAAGYGASRPLGDANVPERRIEILIPAP